MRIMPTAISLLNLVNRGFNYVVKTSELYKIDESHALKHSMEVYGFAKKIYESELIKNINLKEQREIIINAIRLALIETNQASQTSNIYILKDFRLGRLRK